MKRFVLFSLIALFISSFAFSQSFGDIYEKSIQDNAAIPYPFLREADVIWSKRVTRLVDMREKMNLPLYYPTLPSDDGRMSLTSIMLGEIKAGAINAFDPNSMTANVTYSDIAVLMGSKSDTTSVQQMDGTMKETVITEPAKPEEILQMLILEEWFFDKKHSKMDVRIIGFCPIRVFFDLEMGKTSRRQLFWIRYEDFRDTFARHEAYNRSNDAQRISYDDIFMQRRFSSIIYAESNVYDNRQISAYKIGKDALYEAEKVKRELQEFEHDLWEY